MYQLVWCDLGRGLNCSVMGESESLFQVWFHLLRGRKWDVCELWRLGPQTRLIGPGEEVLWWNDDSTNPISLRRAELLREHPRARKVIEELNKLQSDFQLEGKR